MKNMDIVFKLTKGYVNTDNGIKICKEIKNATVYKSLEDAFKQKEEIYKEKHMINIITMEVISR